VGYDAGPPPGVIKALVIQQRVGLGTRHLTGDATVADRSYPIATRLELLHRELPIRQLCVLDPHAWMIAPMAA
jgi:hypothetical protein